MRQLFGCVWFFVGVVVLAWAQVPPLPLDQYPAAVRAQITQAYNEAKAKPQNAAALGQLGMVLQAYNEQQRAVECYLRAQRLAPQEMRWAYYAGLAQAALGKTAEAIALLQPLTEYLPAQLKVADLLLAQNQPREAEALYLAATKKHSASAWAWYGLGRTQAARQDGAAVASLEHALVLAPRFGAAHYALALVLRDAGRVGKAREHLALYQEYRLIRPATDDPWQEAVAALNHSAEGLLNRGVLLEAEGDLPGSIAAHEKALAVDPTLTQAHVNLIQLYGRLAQSEPAEKHYQSVLRLNPKLAEAHYNIGVLWLAASNSAAAQAAFTRAVESNPHYAEAHYNLGVLALREQKLAAAAEHFRTALEANPNFRPAHFEWGRILIAQQQLDEAIRHFEQTITPEDHDTPRYLYALGAAWVRAGQREKGLAYLRQARTQAQARGQQELLLSLERDLKSLEGN